MKFVVAWLAAFGAVLLVLAAAHVRDPVVVTREPVPLIVFSVAWLGVAALGIAVAARSTLATRLVGASVVGALLFSAMANVALRMYRAEPQRAEVLAKQTVELRAATRHVIAGFRSMDEARALAKAGIAGLFLSPRNVRGKTIQAVAADVAGLQALRRAAHLPPLWIAADQEGGIVSNLSPPLPLPPSLASVAGDHDRVVGAMDGLATGLEAVGVNLDLAPVVDIGGARNDPFDRHTRIARRAIPSDPAVVSSVAGLACRRLAAAGIRCTVKHFPGIGSVKGDTHVESAHLGTIGGADLLPFETLTRPQGPQPWVMLAHVVVDDLDAAHPASASAPVIAVLRRRLGYGGILITDDASMAAYRAKLTVNVVATMKGGADFILASYDPDVAFDVIATLVARARTDTALREAMAASDRRLDRAALAEPGPP